MKRLCAVIFSVFGLITMPFLGAAEESSQPFCVTDVMSYLSSWKFLDCSIGELGLSFIIIVTTFVLRNIIVASVFKKLESRAAASTSPFYREILFRLEKPFSLFVLFFGLFLAIQVLPTGEIVELFVTKLYRGASMFLLGWALFRCADSFIDGLTSHAFQGQAAVLGLMPLIKQSIKILIAIVGALVVIQNLGYNIGGILATLGIGGAAIAFASKDTISNFFGSLCLVLDKPFKVGDRIEISGKFEGFVREVGLRSTRVETLAKTSLSIPNSMLANETINNWSKMPKRRIKQLVGITYDTDCDVLADIVNDIRTLLEQDKDVNQEFMYVNFSDFGESSLDIVVCYFTKTTVWKDCLDIKQRINISMMKIIRERGSSMAYPSRTIYFGPGQNLGGLGSSLQSDGGPTMPV